MAAFGESTERQVTESLKDTAYRHGKRQPGSICWTREVYLGNPQKEYRR